MKIDEGRGEESSGRERERERFFTVPFNVFISIFLNINYVNSPEILDVKGLNE